MSERVTSFCVALLFLLTSVSAVKRLNTIKDLKKVHFGQSVPKHSLLLLHWFSNIVDIDNNDVVRLTFDPNNRDYGSHHYGNFEQMLDPLPHGYRYYTVGNLNQDSTMELPQYVAHPPREYVGRNRDRIVFRVSTQNSQCQVWQRIDRVYLTQHYDTSEQQGTRYDPEQTYQVTTHLLRQIREFSVAPNSGISELSELRDHFNSNAADDELWDISNTWGNLACLGLLLFIVIQEKHSNTHKTHSNKPQRAVRTNPQHDFIVNIPEFRQSHTDFVRVIPRPTMNQSDEMQLEVHTGTNGKARISWKNISSYRLSQNVMVVLFDNSQSQEAMKYKCIGNKSSGSYDTSVPLNAGLQARLHAVRKVCCFFTTVGEEICRGPPLKNNEPVNITGYNAKLQLCAKDGKAAARLYVEKSFREWRSEFEKSWVGFYTSTQKPTDDYDWWQWQWATKFTQSYDSEDSNYDVYEYQSGTAIAPGVQARFILRDEEVKARTPSWRY